MKELKDTILEFSEYENSIYYKVFTDKELLDIKNNYTNEEFIDNDYYMEKLIISCPGLYILASERIRNRDDLVNFVLKNYVPGVIPYIPKKYQDDKDEMLKAIYNCPCNLRYLKREFRRDAAFGYALLDDYCNRYYYKYLDKDIWNNTKFAFNAYTKYPFVQRFFDFKVNEDFLIEGLSLYPEGILYMPKNKLTPNIIKYALSCKECRDLIFRNKLPVHVPFSCYHNNIYNSKEILGYVLKYHRELMYEIKESDRKERKLIDLLVMHSNKEHHDFILNDFYIK